MIRNPFRPVCHTYGPAPLESVSGKQALHDKVVLMGVGTQVAALLGAPRYAGVADAFAGSVGGDAMDDVVGGIVQPVAVFDDRVVGVGTGDKAKSADYVLVLVPADT